MDFSLKMYSEICRALEPDRVVTVKQYLSQDIEPPLVIMRHDVDKDLDNALAVAELEYRMGINSTYYFRYPRTFDLVTMSKISRWGHEIGYHYEVMDKAGGNIQKALDIFRQELDIFRRYFPVSTVCRHGNPLTKWDGKEIWEHCDFKDFDLEGEAYLSLADVSVYLTDTGRNWCGSRNIKDFLGSGSSVSIKKTPELIAFLQNMGADRIYLNCHPERWAPGLWGWVKSLLRDKTLNLGKFLINQCHRPKPPSFPGGDTRRKN